MAEKKNPPKKKTKKAVATAAKETRVQATQKRTSAYYVCPPDVRVTVSQQKPKSGNSSSFATFEEARSAAIDALVEVIESAEQQLTKLKRSRSWEQLKAS